MQLIHIVLITMCIVIINIYSNNTYFIEGRKFSIRQISIRSRLFSTEYNYAIVKDQVAYTSTVFSF